MFGKGQEREDSLEIRHLSYEHIDGLIKLQEDNTREFKFFTPQNPMDREALLGIISKVKLDLYYVVEYSGSIIGYAFLRGVDKGYDNFSLGIVIDKKYYGTGLAKMFMSFLELQSKVRGHKTIRLRVFKKNIRAYRLYEKLGYEFTEYDNDSVVGVKIL